jgi:hypothetical protein
VAKNPKSSKSFLKAELVQNNPQNQLSKKPVIHRETGILTEVCGKPKKFP